MTPQQIEALKLALNAMNAMLTHMGMDEHEFNKDTYDQMRQAIAVVKKALAQPEQEPVAIKRMKEWIEYLKRKSDFGQHMKIPSEMSAGTCWELALELEQFINTIPSQQEPVIDKSAAIRIATSLGWTPQRKPLTHEQRFDVLTKFEPHKHEWHAPAILIDLVEAAHGIKE